jgi:hypothetical protein
MTEFLRSIKSDLFSKRLLPFVALLGVALIAAVGYAVTGRSGSSAPAPSAGVPSARAVRGAAALPVAVAPANPNEAVSETPGGARFQSQGPIRDPFVPLPSPPAAKTAASSGSSTSSGKSTGSSSKGSSSGSAGSSSGGSSAGGQKAPAPVPAQPTKPRVVYVVSAAVALPPTAPGQPITVIPFGGLKLNEPLPSKKDVRFSFERVTANGKGAIFKLVIAPILRGVGRCLPSASECQSIELLPGQVEEFEYVETSGQAVDYALKVVAIAKVVVRAGAARVGHNRSPSGLSEKRTAQASHSPTAAVALSQSTTASLALSARHTAQTGRAASALRAKGR